MKKLVSLFLVTAMVFTVSACGNSSQGSTGEENQSSTTSGDTSTGAVTIKMATGGQDTLPSYATALEVIDKVTSANENIEFEYYGARQLGDDAEILQQVMAGTINMGGTAASAFSTYTNLLEALTIPFLLNDYEKERIAMSAEETQVLFDRIEEELGIKILVSYDSGMRHLANNVRPIESIEDLEGLKMRVVPSDILIASFTAMGANPTPLAYGEIYTGLQNKVIDGEEINITSIYSEKHYEVISYFTEIGIYPFATCIFANAAWFNGLDQEVQDALTNGFVEGYDYLFDKYLPEAEAAGFKAMEEQGVEVTKIEDISAFRDAVKSITDEFKTKDEAIANFIEMAEKL